MSCSSDDFSASVLVRLHAMARTRICRKRCKLCAELPKSNPPAPTAETNVLIAMRERRIAEQRARELSDRGADVIWLAPETTNRSPRTPTRPVDVCPVPQFDGIVWAAVQRLVAHAWAFDDEASLCTKRTRTQADWSRTLAPNWCRECQAEVLRRLGRNVYVAGNEIRERKIGRAHV